MDNGQSTLLHGLLHDAGVVSGGEVDEFLVAEERHKVESPIDVAGCAAAAAAVRITSLLGGSG